MSYTPTAVIPSTIRIVFSCLLTISASSFTGWQAVVEVSLACTKTPLISGSALRASATAFGSTAFPHSTIISVTLRPYVWHILVHLSPNLPPFTTTTLSPGEKKLATEASIPPVPEAASMRTSFSVWNNHFSPSAASLKMASNCGVL